MSARDADGTVRFEALASHLPGGVRWEGVVLASAAADDFADLDSREFRRDVSDGTWAVDGRLDLGDYTGPASYHLIVFEARRPTLARFCSVAAVEGRRALGMSWCSPRVHQVLAVRRDTDDALVLRYVQSGRPGSRWSLAIRAVGAGDGATVTVDDQTSARGVLSTRVVLEGVDNPRLFVLATGEYGRRCGMGLDLPNVTTARLPSVEGMRHVAQQLRSRTNRSSLLGIAQ